MDGFDIIPDGRPIEEPEAGADTAYQNIPAPFGQFLGQQVGTTIGQVGRVAEQGAFQGAGLFPRLLYGGLRAIGQAGELENAAPPTPPPSAGSVPSPMLTPDEYNARYAPMGPDGKPTSLGSAPMPDAVAKLVGEAKRDEIARENVTARYENAHSWPTNFAAGTLAFMLDPLRAATAFVPGIGEEAILARLGTGMLARVGARVAAGAATGAIAQAPLSGLEYGLGTQEASDYGLREAFRDMAFAAAGNAIFHAGIGTAADILRGPVPGAAAAPEAVEAAPILSADTQTQHAALSSAVAQLGDGRPVDVRPFFYRPPQAETAVGLALQPTERAQIGAEPTVAAQARRGAPDVFAEYDPLVARVQTLRAQIADPARTIGAEFDRQTDALRQRAEALRGEQQFPVGMAPEDIRTAIAAQTAEHDQLVRHIAMLEGQRDDFISARAQEARQALMVADHRMRDLAPAVSAATRSAEVIHEAAAANRAPTLGPTAWRPDPALVATQQRALYHDGFAAGVPGPELRQTSADIYEPSPEAATEAAGEEKGPEARQAAAAAPSAQAPGAGGEVKPLAETDPELAAAHDRMQQIEGSLSPEERAELDQARTGIVEAETKAAAIDEAANCLKEAGL